ncbi:MAG: chorismate synthase [Bdellovibrionota bacterium]
MNGNRIGTIFQLTTWGESHGPSVGAVIDGCPSGITLTAEDFLEDMARRQGGGAKFATPRKEEDKVQIESGVFEDKTTGTPICLRIINSAQNSADYDAFRDVPRPGHADLTTHLKQGHRDHRGGGRSSARETTARVAAGVVAKKILRQQGIELLAWVEKVGPHSLPDSVQAGDMALAALKSARDQSTLHIPHSGPEAEELLRMVETLRTAGDSWGGTLACRVEGLPPGIGEPIFDKLNALLAHALMSLPAAVAFECGGGARMSELPGSAIRDSIAFGPNGPAPTANRHGGILGGMSTGLPLSLSISFHAPTSIPRSIASVDLRTKESKEITVGGRHDAFPLPRAVPMVEAMVAITLVDALMRAGRIPEKI